MMDGTAGDDGSNGLEGDLKDVLAFIGRGVRLEMLGVLAEGPRDVTSLADELKLGVTLVSNHLCLMARFGLLEVQVIKKRHIYQLSPRLQAAHYRNGEHFFLATEDGGWALLYLSDGKMVSSPTPPIQELRIIAEMIEKWRSNGHGPQTPAG